MQTVGKGADCSSLKVRVLAAISRCRWETIKYKEITKEKGRKRNETKRVRRVAIKRASVKLSTWPD